LGDDAEALRADRTGRQPMTAEIRLPNRGAETPEADPMTPKTCGPVR
jgi:hypothetical protein